MEACILAIGDELLEGRVDTNSSFLAQALDEVGWLIRETRQCRDRHSEIVRSLEELSVLAPLVITTGGLGPTTDDLTTQSVAAWAGAQVIVNEAHWHWLQERFLKRYGKETPPENIKQAQLPQGAQIIPNPVGVALGYVAERDGRRVASFPGVPREMQAMVRETLQPLLRQWAGRQEARVVRRLRIFGHTESATNQLMHGIADSISQVEIAYLVSYPEIHLFFKVTRPSRREAERVADALAIEARRRLGDRVYGEGDELLEAVVGGLLKKRGWRVATAESCTGGLIAKRLTDISGSSAYFQEGVVTYQNEAKTRVLGVAPATLEKYGAVSAETCAEMLEGLLVRTGAHVGIAVTGIAGPTGGTPEKPVGLVYIGWGSLDASEVKEYQFYGSRDEIRLMTAGTALDKLRRFLLPQVG